MTIELLAYIPFGFEGAFKPFFDELDTLTDDVSSKLKYFTFTLAFAGLLITAYRQQVGGDLSQVGTQLLMTACVSMALIFMPDWIYDAEEVLGWNMVNDMRIDPEDICLNFITDCGIFISGEVAMIIANLTASILTMGLDITLLISALVGMVVVIIVAFCALFVFVATLLAYAVEAASVQLGVATLPLFLGMLLFQTTKETAIRYMTGITAMLFWPLGWGIGFKLLDTIMSVWADIALACAPLVALDLFYGGIVDAVGYLIVTFMFWTVIKKAPPLVTKALTTGTQIGAGLVSAGVASAATTMSSMVNAAGDTISSAASIGGTAAGAAIGSAAPGVGTAAGASIGGSVGGAAGSAVSGATGAAASGIKGAGEGLAGMSEGV